MSNDPHRHPTNWPDVAQTALIVLLVLGVVAICTWGWVNS